MPAARSVAAVARPSARATDGRPVAAIAGRAARRRARQPLHAAALLVDHEQQRRPQAGRPRDAPQRPRERADLRRRAEVGAQEDDPRRLAAADAREQRRRRRAPGEGEDDVLAGELRVGQPRAPAAPRASRPPSRQRPSAAPVPLAVGLVLGAAGGERQGDGGERGGASPHRAKLVSAVRRCAAAAMSSRRVGDVLELHHLDRRVHVAQRQADAAARDAPAREVHGVHVGAGGARRGLDREGDRLGLGGLVEQLDDARVEVRAALDDRPRAEGVRAELVDVDAGRVGGVRDVDDDGQVRAQRVGGRPRPAEGRLLLHGGDGHDVAGRAAGLVDEPRGLVGDVAAEAVVHRARDGAIVGQLDGLALDDRHVADAHEPARLVAVLGADVDVQLLQARDLLAVVVLEQVDGLAPRPRPRPRPRAWPR